MQQRYEHKLKQMLDSNNANIVAICGDWGVGKTHFWKELAERYYKNNNILYHSHWQG